MNVGLATIYAELRSACVVAGGQRAWAVRHGVSEQVVCDVLNARRDPSPAVLAALGFVRNPVTYRRSNGG